MKTRKSVFTSEYFGREDGDSGGGWGGLLEFSVAITVFFQRKWVFLCENSREKKVVEEWTEIEKENGGFGFGWRGF